jgi:hypothetical protein
MSTIYVKWPRVLTAATEKRFQIILDDERRYYGSLQASETLGRVVIRADRDTLEVATQSVVELKRIKETFWNRLDGSLDFGFGFTQQNAKTDLSLRSETRYLMDRNRFNLTLDGSSSRQDSVSDITRGTARLFYIRELKGLWFVGFAASAEQNSQLSLDIRGSLRGGPGRYFIANSRMELGTLLAIGYSRERFAGEEARNTVPLALVTDYRFFNWSGLDTNLSSRLSIEPVLNDRGRWRISFTANSRRRPMRTRTTSGSPRRWAGRTERFLEASDGCRASGFQSRGQRVLRQAKCNDPGRTRCQLHQQLTFCEHSEQTTET